MKTIFISTIYREALHWAVQWGFSPRTVNTDWYWVGRPEHARGLYNTHNLPVFVCGSHNIDKEIIDSVLAANFNTFMDAHDLVPFLELSALELLPA